MNKIILGSALVTVMGGVPGATYLLTRKEDITNSIAQPESIDTKGRDEHSNSRNPGSSGPATSGHESENSVTSDSGEAGQKG